MLELQLLYFLLTVPLFIEKYSSFILSVCIMLRGNQNINMRIRNKNNFIIKFKNRNNF